MTEERNIRFRVAGHLATEWSSGITTAGNPVLLDRELALETDTGKFKIGDGATPWNSLAYHSFWSAWGRITGTLSDQTDLQAALNLKAPLASPPFTGTPTGPTAAPGTNNTQLATTAFVAALVSLATTGLLDLKGDIDCSANPNYPAASKGDAYVVSVAGKIGGASGVSVDIGDTIIAKADNAGGTQASVGSSWWAQEHNIAGALIAANNLSDVSSASAARSNLGLVIGTNVFTQRTFSGTGNEITVTNGDGTGGNPTFSLPSALTFTGKTITGGTYTGLVSIAIGAGSPANSLPNGAGGSFTPQASINPTSGVAGYGIMVNDGTNNRRAALFLNQTNGVWGLSMTYSSGAIPFVINVAGQENLRLENGNLTLPNTLSAPSTPTGGGTLYVQGGALKYLGSSGTVTTIAPA